MRIYLTLFIVFFMITFASNPLSAIAKTDQEILDEMEMQLEFFTVYFINDYSLESEKWDDLWKGCPFPDPEKLNIIDRIRMTGDTDAIDNNSLKRSDIFIREGFYNTTINDIPPDEYIVIIIGFKNEAGKKIPLFGEEMTLNILPGEYIKISTNLSVMGYGKELVLGPEIDGQNCECENGSFEEVTLSYEYEYYGEKNFFFKELEDSDVRCDDDGNLRFVVYHPFGFNVLNPLATLLESDEKGTRFLDTIIPLMTDSEIIFNENPVIVEGDVGGRVFLDINFSSEIPVLGSF